MIKSAWCMLVMIIAFFCNNDESSKIENGYVAVHLIGDSVSIASKNGKEFQVSSFKLTGGVGSFKKTAVNDNIWGKGEQLLINHDKIYRTTFTVYVDDPFVHVHTTVVNKTDNSIDISKLAVAAIQIPVENDLKELNTLGTGGLKPIKEAEGSYLYSLLADPATRRSVLAGWLTQNQGIGTFSPKIDSVKGRQTYTLTAGLEFGNYLVKPGQERGTDVLLVGFFEDGRKGLEYYGDHLAKAYKIHLPPKPEVYCTWYHRDLTGSGASTETEIRKNISFIADKLAPFGLNTVQIDDHWQSSLIEGLTYKNVKNFKQIQIGGGPLKTFVSSNFNYPSGMQDIAGRIGQKKLTPGIWFMPFAGDVHNPHFDAGIFAKDVKTGKPFESKKWSGTCIDASSPKGEAFLRERFKRIYDWGFRYFKIDGLHTGAPSENIYVNRAYNGTDNYAKAKIYDSGLTFVQCFRKGMKILKEEAPGAFTLGCTVTQNMSSFGSAIGAVDAMRVGPDNDSGKDGNWKNVTKGADYAGNLYFLNNKVWYNDPDPYYVNEGNPIDKARWMVSWQAVAGVMGTSSVQYADLPADRLALLKRALPTHNLHARPVDVLENPKPNIWMVGNERLSIIGLFNWKEKDQTIIDYPLDKLGLDNAKSYEVFDFWKNEYLGNSRTALKSTLAPASCQVLAVRESRPYPQVLSTSRHITQGLMDIISESWDKPSKTLSGKSKVVKDDLYELRIVLPPGVTTVKSAKCDGKSMTLDIKGKLARVSYSPEKTGEVQWEIRF